MRVPELAAQPLDAEQRGLDVAGVVAGFEQQEVGAAFDQRPWPGRSSPSTQLVESHAAGDGDGFAWWGPSTRRRSAACAVVEYSSAAWRASLAASEVQLVGAVLRDGSRRGRSGCRRRCWSRRCRRRPRGTARWMSSMTSGRVTLRTFSRQFSIRGRQKSLDGECAGCSMVPMAPSRTRTRCPGYLRAPADAPGDWS